MGYSFERVATTQAKPTALSPHKRDQNTKLKQIERVDTDNHHKQSFILLGVTAALLGFISKLAYRPWVLNHQIDDFGFQGFAPSYFYMVGICFVIAGFSKKYQIKNMLLAAAGATVYELEQCFTSRVFDYKDLLAIGIGLASAIFIGRLIHRNRQEEVPVNEE